MQNLLALLKMSVGLPEGEVPRLSPPRERKWGQRGTALWVYIHPMSDRRTPSRGGSARMSGCDIATKRQVQTNAQTDGQTDQCVGRHRSRREELVGSPVCAVSREGSPVEDRARCVRGEERR